MTTLRRIGTTRRILPVAMGLGLLTTLILFFLFIAFSPQLTRLEYVYSNEGMEGLLARLEYAYSDEGMWGLVSRLGVRNPWVEPNVQWETDMPEILGMDASKLEILGHELGQKNTDAFLVIKDGKLVHEWYAPGKSANSRHSTSAMAKAVTASIALGVAADDGLLGLDDPVWKYIPAWKEDPIRSKISIRQLGSHTSGLDDVEFEPARSDPEWKHTYYEHRELRFPLAISTAPVIAEPGTRYSYSGVGYYVLAYVLTSSLRGSSYTSIHDLIEKRIMKPLDIPVDAWELSYGESYDIDGMKLYAFGSGVRQTARSIARIGQLVLNKGEWNGRQVIDPAIMDGVTSNQGLNSGGKDGSAVSPRGIGWRMNDGGLSKALPRDAIIGVGRGPNVTLVIPSMNLVAVRIGGSLTDSAEQSANLSWEDLDEVFFAPLVASVDSSNIDQPDSESRLLALDDSSRLETTKH